MFAAIVVLAVCVLGLGYHFSKRIVRQLPPTELAKITGQADISNYGWIELFAYNGSEFILTEVLVSVSVFDEKGSPIISNRVYRLPAYYFYPQSSRKLSTDLGFRLEAGQSWKFWIVGAKGRPE